uniref:NADH-ubiquinone oxidoreductase chain 3 n=2 Tax=Pseudoperonospora TaxID=143452 RepID=A0A4D6C5K3_9STRA|nr:NADH dehydrogenase subunit 3 [Pseudoperonospora cubensis]YP_009645867.1 NADH dehydrogenase subunit 3 [Pseudoperonospora humuli]AKZ29820.1 NADH dehydrogenase subunit 3 [Pseudoperonospora cubensis]QBX98965.1 NADH dehydrogenase subunit 3 [Pseudoperonospora humuli]
MLLNYSNIFIFLILSLFLSILIFTLSFSLIKQKDDLEKLTAYECGFNPYDDARKVFDVKFYLVAILFIIFDLEAVFVFPWVLTLSSNFSWGFWTMIEFLVELVIGFIYIWCSDALEW